MSGASIMIVAFLLALGAMSFAFAGGAAIVAVPLALIGIAAVAVVDLHRRRKQARHVQVLREEAKAEKVEFTPRDKQTLASE